MIEFHNPTFQYITSTHIKCQHNVKAHNFLVIKGTLKPDFRFSSIYKSCNIDQALQDCFLVIKIIVGQCQIFQQIQNTSKPLTLSMVFFLFSAVNGG